VSEAGTTDKTIPRPAAHVLTANAIRAAILEGVLGPGVQIRQDEMAKTYGVSQATVREAFRSLEAERLLESMPNRGVFVRVVTKEDVIEVYELRTALETHALRRNLGQLQNADLHRARILLETAAKDERYAFIGSPNKDFHAVFYALDEASLTADLISRCFGSITPTWMQFIRELPDEAKKYDDESAQHHWELLRACENGSMDGAIAMIERHLSHACGVLTTFISDSAATRADSSHKPQTKPTSPYA